MTNIGLVSIIIPVFNTENYLEKCLKSILAQTYTFFEVIIVLDGANERCCQICQRYASFDERIVVYEIVHQGVSVARNYGLKIMQGDFVAFIDSDDVLHPCYLETLLNDISYYNTEIACCNFVKNGSEFPDEDDRGEAVCVSGIEGIRYCSLGLNNGIFYGTSLWNKMFRVSALNKSDLFDVSFTYGEDTKFLFPIMLRSDKVSFNSAVRYLYLGNRTGNKREYSSYSNFIKYYQWKHDFFFSNKLESEVVKNIQRTLHELKIYLWIDKYINGEKEARNKLLSEWSLLKYYMINHKFYSILGKAKIKIVLYMIRLSMPRGLVSLIWNMHD